MADAPAQTEADQRAMTHGDIVTHEGTDYEVTAVSHENDDSGNHVNFQYTIRNKSELDAERKAQADAEAAAQKEQEDAAATEEAARKEREDLLNVNLGTDETPAPEGVQHNG